MAGLAVQVIGGKGSILALNHRIVNTVVNRCKMPGDGDIIVPVHTVAVIGTTDTRVENPEDTSVQDWEVERLLDEGEKLIPGIREARLLRCWSGVRPLYQASHAGASRDATRAFTLLDHRARDGVSGFLTIIGGKWTTFRLMAEKTVDQACVQLGSNRPCLTAQTPVPGADHGNYWMGHRLHEVEQEHLQNDLVCECELVTRAMIENAAREHPTVTLDDLRRDVRLGMGPCQGGFCMFRAAAILHELASEPRTSRRELAAGEESWNVASMQSPAFNSKAHLGSAVDYDHPNRLLNDFLQERWKGLVPILWGEQLKQERLDELTFLCLLNADHLPDVDATSGAPGGLEQTGTTSSTSGGAHDD
jgi:glycerol-3-phosphate dehydrogenase